MFNSQLHSYLCFDATVHHRTIFIAFSMWWPFVVFILVFILLYLQMDTHSHIYIYVCM